MRPLDISNCSYNSTDNKINFYKTRRRRKITRQTEMENFIFFTLPLLLALQFTRKTHKI